MIRVLHIVNKMDYGGLETFIMNIYRNIDRSVVQFDFLVHTDKKCDYDEEIIGLGGNIFSVPSRKKGIIKNWQALNEFFKNHKNYTIIHQHSSSLSYIEPLIAGKRHNIKTRIIHSHSTKPSGNKLNKYIHIINRLYIKKYATNYFACSDVAGKWLFGKNTFNIINNGVDFQKFKYNEKVRNDIRSQLNIENNLVIGHVGRFSYPKNHDFLIDIFNSVRTKRKDAKLLLVGDGNLKPLIEKKVAALNLSEDVHFLGIRADVFNILQALDIVVFPSHYEGLPVTLVEAQASGLKCVVSDTITRQVAISNLISFKKITDNADSWAEKITQESNYIRENLSADLNNKFDIIKVAQELECFYQECNKTNKN